MIKRQKNIKPATGGKDKKGSKRLVVTLTAAVFVVLAAAAVIYFAYLAPPRKAVLKADGHPITMDYLLKRTIMAGGDATLTLQQLAYEQVVRIEGAAYNVTPSAADIDASLQKMAADAGVPQAGYPTWYNSRLRDTGLTNAQYREIVATGIMADRLTTYLTANISTTAEQVHLFVIVVASQEDATGARARIAAGEKFSDVASAVSLDASTKDKGGDVGWIPRGVTPYDDTIFNLDPGEVTLPIAADALYPGQYALFQVTEKDPNRPIDPGPLAALKERALFDFILRLIPQHVKFYFNSADQQWMEQQLAKHSLQ